MGIGSATPSDAFFMQAAVSVAMVVAVPASSGKPISVSISVWCDKGDVGQRLDG